MNKIIKIFILSLYLSNSCFAKDYLFSNNIYTDCDIVSKKDVSYFQNLSFIEEKEILFWDRRTITSRGWNKSIFKAFIFNTKFKNGRDIIVRVNSEFKTKDKAEKKAIKYSKMLGQIPKFLKKSLKTVTIHKGNKPWGGGNFDILIHTEADGSKGKCAEELMLHESGHVSLDETWGGLIPLNDWKKVAKLDNKYISKYAKDFPDREDISETINWWLAVRCKQDRISKSNYKKILKAIPNRLKYLDEHNFDTSPLVCNYK